MHLNIFKMKNRVRYIIILILSPMYIFSQPGGRPMAFKIDFSIKYDQNISLPDFTKKYEVRTYIFRNKVQFYTKEKIENLIYFSNGQGYLNNSGPFLEENRDVFKKKYPGFLEIFLENDDNQIEKKNNKIESGSILSLQLKDRTTKKVMNIFVRIKRSIPYIGTNNSITLKGLSFVEGSFFYDLIDYQYSPVTFDYANYENREEASLVFSSYSNTISIEKLNSILLQKDSTPPYLNIVTQSVKFRDEILKSYQIQITNTKDSNFRIDNRDILRELRDQANNIYIPYTLEDNIESGAVICLRLTSNLDKRVMSIFIKIYKKYEDYNRNEINIKNFSFEDGYFYFNMESDKEDKYHTESKFVDNFDMSDIEDFRVTKEQIENSLK